MDYIGWDLIHKVSENDIHKKEDVLVLAIHYLLIKSGYRCAGVGDDKALSGNETSSETLPTGWSQGNNYSLRYIRNDELFVLRGTPNDNTIVFNLLKVSALSVSSIVLNPSIVVGSLKGSLKDLLPTYEEVLGRLKTELVDSIGNQDGASKEATTQTTQLNVGTSPRPHGPVRSPPSHPSRPPATVDPFWNDPTRDPLRVGGADLDPLGRGGTLGGGMIFDPFSGRGIPDPGIGLPGPPLPRGAIPPGARFDPFGPIGPGRGSRGGRGGVPDPDHLDPPGFGGMFM